MAGRSRCILYVWLLALTGACTEHSTAPTPLANARISLRPHFNTNGAQYQAEPINRIRLVARNATTDEVLGMAVEDVNPNAAEWTLNFEVPVTDATRVVVTMELIHVAANGTETVEWSGITPEFELSPGTNATQQDVQVFPGPLDNLQVTAISISGLPTGMLEGDQAQLIANITAPGTTQPRAFWVSSDPAVLSVDANGLLRAHGPGTVQITAQAATRTSTVSITVGARAARIVIDPASATLEHLGAEQTFTATVLDARNAPVPNSAVSWTVADPSVLLNLGGGRFRALKAGSTTIQAAAVSAPSVTATAPVQVMQRVTRVTVTPPSSMLEARGATVQLTAVAEDAGGNAVTQALSWTTSDAAVATVDQNGLVTAVTDGTATIRATAGTVTGSAEVRVARRASRMSILAGNNQTGRAGEFLPIAPAVRIADANDHPVAGVAVSFLILSGNGQIETAATTTDANGIARAGGWMLGGTLGEQTLRATASSFDPVIFVATATAGAPSNLAIHAGDNQTADAGTAVPTPPAVRVTDLFGNPVAGATVQFAVVAGGGAVTGASPTTDANGIAAVGSWTLGNTAGENRLTATVSGVTPVTFVATGESDPVPTTISIHAGDDQTAAVGHAVAIAPAVRVTDASNNPMSGVTVTFATSNGASVTDAVVVTNADGVATVGTWTLGTTPGEYQLTATVEGLTPVTFTATAHVGAPTTLTIHAGNDQSSTVATAVAVDPAVRVTDAYGNAVAGVTVQFAVAQGGGQVTDAAPVTDANGIATIGSWTLGNTPGENQLTATATGLDPVTFLAHATVGGATQLVIHAGNNQTANVTSEVAIDPAVRVTDAQGNAVAGVTVEFAIGVGGGAVTGATPVTDANGVATVGSWTLGPNGGQHTLIATVAGLEPVTFTATAFDPCPFVALTLGTTVNGVLTATDCVAAGRITDHYTFTLTESTALTIRLGPTFYRSHRYELIRNGEFAYDHFRDAESGQLFVESHLLPPGDYVLRVQAQNSGELGGYELITTLGDIAACRTRWILAGIDIVQTISNTDCQIGDDLADLHFYYLLKPQDAALFSASSSAPLVIRVRSGNVVIASSGAPSKEPRLFFDRPLSLAYSIDVIGEAAQVPTTYRWQVSEAEPPATVSVQGGDGQTADVGTQVQTAPSVIVRTAAGAPAPGVRVNFAVTGGGGSIVNAVAVTDDSGIAAVGSWTLGATPGPNTLTATVAGLTPVVFTATGAGQTSSTITLALAGGHTNVGVSFTQPLNITLSAEAPVGGVTITVTSDNTSKLTVAAPGTVFIAGGETQGTIQIHGEEAGTATLTATAPGYDNGQLTVSVSLRLISLPLTLNVPYGATTSLPIQLAEPAPQGGVVVSVVSQDESRVRVLTPTVTFAAGATLASATVEGALPGTANVTANAPGYIGATSSVTTRANLDIVESSIVLNASFGNDFTVRLRSAGNPIAAPEGGVQIQLAAVNPACASVPATALIAEGLTQTTVNVTYGGSATLTCNTRVHATAQNILPDSVNVRVDATPVLSLQTATVGAGLQRSQAVLLNTTNHEGVLVHLTSADPSRLLLSPNASTVGTETLELFIAAGTTSVPFVAQSLGGLGAVGLTVTGAQVASGSGTINIVQPALDLSGLPTSTTTQSSDDLFTVRIGLPNTGNTALTELQAVRAGAPPVVVTVQSDSPSVATLTTSAGSAAVRTVEIAAQQSSSPSVLTTGGIALNPIAAGVTVVRASAPGFTTMTSTGVRTIIVNAATLTVSGATVGAGLMRSPQLVSLGSGAHGGITVRVTSNDPARLLVSANTGTAGTAFIDVPLLNGQSSFNFVVHALEGATGSVTVTATAPAYTPGTGTYTLVSAALDLSGVPTIMTTTTADDPFIARIGIANTGGTALTELQSVRTAGPGFQITVTTSANAIGTLVTTAGTTASTTLHIGAGENTTPSTVAGGGVAVRPLSQGSTTIAATGSGLLATTAASRVVTIAESSIAITDNRVASGLQRAQTGNLGGQDHGGVTVRVQSAQPDRLLIAPDATTIGTEFIDIFVPNGSTTFRYVTQALDDVTGGVVVTATAPGFTDRAVTVEVVQPGFDIAGLSTTGNTLSADDPFTVRIGLPSSTNDLAEFQARRFGAAPLIVTATSSTTAGQIVTSSGAGGSGQAQIIGGATQTPTTVAAGGFAFRAFSAGATVVSASIPGFRALTPSQVTVNVNAPGITLTSVTVGGGLQRSASGSLSSGNHGGVTVHVSSSNSGVALVSPNATTAGASAIDIFVPNGQSSFSYVVHGIEDQTATVAMIATAAGFTDGSATANVVQPALDISGLNGSYSTIGIRDNFIVRIGLPNTNATALLEVQSRRAGAPALNVSISSNNPSVARLATSSGAGSTFVLPIPAGSSSTPSTVAAGGIRLEPVSPGEVTISATIPGFILTAGIRHITIVPPAFTVNSATVGAGLQKATSFQLNGTNHGGITVTLTSADPSRLLLSPNATTAGSASITVPVANGVGTMNYFVQGIEGVTGSVTVTATATGFNNGSNAMTVVQSALDISGLRNDMTTAAPDDPFTVRVGLPNSLLTALVELQNVRAGSPGLIVTLTSSNDTIGRLVTSSGTGSTVTSIIGVNTSSTPATVAAGGVAFEPLAVGSTVVTATAPGLRVLPTSSNTVNVN